MYARRSIFLALLALKNSSRMIDHVAITYVLTPFRILNLKKIWDDNNRKHKRWKNKRKPLKESLHGKNEWKEFILNFNLNKYTHLEYNIAAMQPITLMTWTGSDFVVLFLANIFCIILQNLVWRNWPLTVVFFCSVTTTYYQY